MFIVELTRMLLFSMFFWRMRRNFLLSSFLTFFILHGVPFSRRQLAGLGYWPEMRPVDGGTP